MSKSEFKSLLDIIRQEHFRAYLAARQEIDARMAADSLFYSSARFNAYHQLIAESISAFGEAVREKLIQVGALQFNPGLLERDGSAALRHFVGDLKEDYEARCSHARSKNSVGVPLPMQPIDGALERQIRELGYAAKEASNSGGFVQSFRNLPSEILKVSTTRLLAWLFAAIFGGWIVSIWPAVQSWLVAFFPSSPH